jgi:geranylgeranyl reductase family protein
VDVVIVGAGPAGCRTAEIIARRGYEVFVLEEHPNIGKPVQCTGLVSNKIGKIPKKIILNKIKRARFCCGNDYFEIKSRKPMLLLDREKYDVWMARNAQKVGAEIKLSTKFLDFQGSTVFTDKGKIDTKILVGADGPNSSVARATGIKLPGNLLFAVQVNVRSHFDSNTVELWFGNDIAPGSFAWVVPEDEEVARVGLVTHKKLEHYLENFLKKRFGKVEARNKIGDMIRYGLIKESVAENVLLAGDAACQVKPYSFGGLVYNKIGAEIAAGAIVKSLEENCFSKEFLLKNYDEKWKEKLAWPINQGLFFKWLFSQISGIPFIFALVRILNLNKLADFLDVDFLQK